MAKQVVEALIEGGKATAAPPLGPALGPLGVNIGQVISEINKKTSEFKGVQVPVKIIVETTDKSFTISVGTPPTSALVKKEAGIEKGSGDPLRDKVANIRIEQVIKIAKMKSDSLLGKGTFARVKEVLGTCNSMGVMVEGRPAKEIIEAINKGEFKEEIAAEKTELSAEELKQIEEEKKKLQAELEKKRAEYTAIAKQIIESMAGKPRGTIRAKLVEAKIPAALIEELLAAAAAPTGAPPEASKTATVAQPKKE